MKFTVLELCSARHLAVDSSEAERDASSGEAEEHSAREARRSSSGRVDRRRWCYSAEGACPAEEEERERVNEFGYLLMPLM